MSSLSRNSGAESTRIHKASDHENARLPAKTKEKQILFFDFFAIAISLRLEVDFGIRAQASRNSPTLS
jgi:hypothetical protein